MPGRRRPSDRWPAALLAAVLLTSWLATAWMPLFDPDEGYYPAAAAETRRGGSFWDIRFNAAPRWDKPVLSYALIEASFALLGEDVLAARLPSALEGTMLVLLVAAVVGRLSTRRAGFLSALVVGTTLGVSVFARVACGRRSESRPVGRSESDPPEGPRLYAERAGGPAVQPSV